MNQHYGWQLLFLVYFGCVWFAITRPSGKILEQTLNKLAFRLRPTFFWGIEVFFSGIGLIGLLVTLTIAPITTLTYNRTAPSQLSPSALQNAPASAICELVEINWFGREKSKTFISGLQGATEETKIEKDSDGKTTSVYRVVLYTNGGDVPFTEKYIAYDDENRQALISQINTFIENPLQASLKVQQDNKLLGYTGFAISSFFLFLSLLVIALVPVINCTLDRELDRITIKRQRWFGTKEIQHLLSEISDIQVEYSSGNEGGTYRVTLSLSAGDNLPLTWSYTSGFEEKHYLAVLIKSFLNLSGSNSKRQASTASSNN